MVRKTAWGGTFTRDTQIGDILCCCSACPVAQCVCVCADAVGYCTLLIYFFGRGGADSLTQSRTQPVFPLLCNKPSLSLPIYFGLLIYLRPHPRPVPARRQLADDSTSELLDLSGSRSSHDAECIMLVIVLVGGPSGCLLIAVVCIAQTRKPLAPAPGARRPSNTCETNPRQQEMAWGRESVPAATSGS